MPGEHKLPKKGDPGYNGLPKVIRDAIGAEPDEEVGVTGPIFERKNDDEPFFFPRSVEDVEALKDAPPSFLEMQGMRRWKEREDGVVWLFPEEWRDVLPVGVEVVTIMDTRVQYHPDNFRDIRFGCLACGIVARHDGAA